MCGSFVSYQRKYDYIPAPCKRCYKELKGGILAKRMTRKELLAEIERLKQLPETEKQYIDRLDAQSLLVARTRYRLMTVALRKKMAKQDPIFHRIMTNDRLAPSSKSKAQGAQAK